MKSKNYFIDKNSKTGEILYLEYEKIAGYTITPKTKVEDAIIVNKIVFVNPSLREKIIKKKIDIKTRYLLRRLTEINEDSSGDISGIKNTLMDAEKLRIMILNNYTKYLGHTYQSLTLQKIQLIINQLRIKLYDCIDNKRRMQALENLYYLEEDEYRGRSR